MPKKKLTRSKLVKKLDNIFSQYIRLSNSVNDIAECVTCNKKDHWKKMQCGHFQSRKHYSTRWDERNVAVQCAGCNVFRYGEQFKFSLYLGVKLSEELLQKSRETVKFADVDLLEMIENYSDKVKKLLL
tara:strand:- start:1101 stop:1487 length:387 start_codon:yes stop_codon:yes gene_type:complete